MDWFPFEHIDKIIFQISHFTQEQVLKRQWTLNEVHAFTKYNKHVLRLLKNVEFS